MDRRRSAFETRTGFALLWSLIVHERRAGDPRNFVRTARNMALRVIGKRNATARWIGKDALRELTSPMVGQRFAC